MLVFVFILWCALIGIGCTRRCWSTWNCWSYWKCCKYGVNVYVCVHCVCVCVCVCVYVCVLCNDMVYFKQHTWIVGYLHTSGCFLSSRDLLVLLELKEHVGHLELRYLPPATPPHPRRSLTVPMFFDLLDPSSPDLLIIALSIVGCSWSQGWAWSQGRGWQCGWFWSIWRTWVACKCWCGWSHRIQYRPPIPFSLPHSSLS